MCFAEHDQMVDAFATGRNVFELKPGKSSPPVKGNVGNANVSAWIYTDCPACSHSIIASAKCALVMHK
jgi:hypothetical protein